MACFIICVMSCFGLWVLYARSISFVVQINQPTRWQLDRPRPTALLPTRSNGKPEAATAVDGLLMMGMRMPETFWAVFKRQAINVRDWCIWLVDLFECLMIHWLTNPKFSFVMSVRLSARLSAWNNSVPIDGLP